VEHFFDILPQITTDGKSHTSSFFLLRLSLFDSKTDNKANWKQVFICLASQMSFHAKIPFVAERQIREEVYLMAMINSNLPLN